MSVSFRALIPAWPVTALGRQPPATLPGSGRSVCLGWAQDSSAHSPDGVVRPTPLAQDSTDCNSMIRIIGRLAGTHCTPTGMNWIQGGIDAPPWGVHYRERRIHCCRSGMNSTRKPMNCTPSRIHCMRSGIHCIRSRIDSIRIPASLTPRACAFARRRAKAYSFSVTSRPAPAAHAAVRTRRSRPAPGARLRRAGATAAQRRLPAAARPTAAARSPGLPSTPA